MKRTHKARATTTQPQAARPSRIIRKPELFQLVGLRDESIRLMEKAGNFPKRVQLTSNAVGWFEAEVHAWLESRARGTPKRTGVTQSEAA